MNENDRLPGEPADVGRLSDEMPPNGLAHDDQAFGEAEDGGESGNSARPGERDDESDAEAGDDRRRRPSGYQRLKRRAGALLAENVELLRAVEDLRSRLPADRGDFAPADRAPVRGELDVQDSTDAQLRRESDERRERMASYQERVSHARERIDDFDEAMLHMRGVTVRDDVIDEIMTSDKGPLIAYHLAKNPAELHELNGMGARELSRALGRLEGRLSLPGARTTTKTPPPPSIPRGGAAASSDPAKMSQRDYEAWRKKGGGKG